MNLRSIETENFNVNIELPALFSFSGDTKQKGVTVKYF